MTPSEIILKYGLPDGVETSDPKDYLVGAEPMSDTKFSDITLPATPEPSEGFIGRGIQSLGRGVVQGKDIAGGLTMMVGEATGSEALKTLGEDMTIEAKRYSIENQSPVPTYSDIGGVGDFFEYATSSILEMLPMNVALLATGVGGAGIAGKLATGAFRGAITKEIAAGITDEMITKFGVEGAKQELGKMLALEAKSRAAQQVGAKLGVGAGSSLVETGSSASQINTETGTTGGASTLALGIAGGATDIFGGEAKALTSVLKGSAGEKAGQAVKHIGKAVIDVQKSEVPQELLQNTISQTALQIQTPEKNQFGAEFGAQQIDTALKTALGIIPVGVMSGVATLPPSADPTTRAQEADIANKINQLLPDDLKITPEDEANAAAAAQPDGESIPPSESGNAVVKDPAPTKEELAEKLIIANDNVEKAVAKLTVIRSEDEINIDQEAAAQEEWKQALSEVARIQGAIDGINPEDMKPYRRTPLNPDHETGLAAPSTKKGKTWIDRIFKAETDPLTYGVKSLIKATLTPHADLLRSVIADGIKFTKGTSRANKTGVSITPDGGIHIQINTDHAEKLPFQRLKEVMFHEVVHAAKFAADRVAWLKERGQEDFSTYARGQSRVRAQQFRIYGSKQMLADASAAYTGGKDRTGAMFDPATLDESGVPLGERADFALDQELTRMMVEKLRNGKMDEELKILAAQADAGNVASKKNLAFLIDAIKRLRDSLVQFINTKTAPKEITDIIKATQKILDKYSDRTQPTYNPAKDKTESPVVTSEKEAAPDTLPEEKKPVASNVEQTETPPEAENTPEAASTGTELLPSTEHGQYFETQDWNGTPTGTTLIRTEVPAGQDPAAAIKATQKYRDLVRKSKVFSQGAPFEIPVIANDNAEAGSEIPDNIGQATYIDTEAKAQGYDGIDDLYENNEDQYNTLANNWRIRHPIDDETGTRTTEERAEAVDTALGSGGSLGSGDTLLDAARNLGPSERTNTTNERVQEDSQRLKKWAEKNDRVVAELPFKLDGPDDLGGTEHHAYFDENSQRWIKVTRADPRGFGLVEGEGIKSWGTRQATAREYVDRLIEQNRVFGDDIRLHGIYIDKAGRPHIITSQPDIGGTNADVDEIAEAMKNAGFEEVGYNGYYRERDNLFIGDLHAGNAHMVDGTLVIFDGLPARPSGRFLDQILDDMAGTRADSTVDSAEAGMEIPEYEAEFVDGMIGEMRGASNILKAGGAKPKKLNSEMKKYGGAMSPHLERFSRPQWVNVEDAIAFIQKNGYMEAMRKATKEMGAMHPADKLTIRGILAYNYDAFKDYVESLKIPYAQRSEILNEAATLRDEIQERFIPEGTKSGQEIAAFKILKQFFYNGTAAAYETKKLLFNAAQQVEKALGLGAMNSVYEVVKGALPKAIDEVFTKRELMAHLSALARTFSANPDHLFKRIRESIKTRKAGSRAAWKAAARIGEEILRDGGEFHLDTLVKRVTSLIEMNQAAGAKKTGRNLLNEALTKFAKDNFPKEKVPSTKSKDRNIQILATIIANDKLKNQFVTELENSIAKQYIGGKESAGYKRDYAGVFDEMRQEGWSDKMRLAALEDVKKKLGLTIGKMLSSGAWEDQKSKVLSTLKQTIGGFLNATDLQLSTLIDEVNADLDAQAEFHIQETFGFKRGAGGNYELTKAGGLKGGQNLVKVIRELGSSLKDITKMSYASKDAEINKLANAAVNNLGLPIEMALKFQQVFAKELENAVEWTKNAELQKRLDGVLDKLNKPKDRPETKSVIDKLVQLANQGYLSEEHIYESIRKTYKNSKLPAFNPAIAEMIREYGNEMDLLPEGELKNIIRQKIANEIANATPMSGREALTSYWYFSLLSGPSTFLVANPVGNAANLLFQTLAMAGTNPKAGLRMFARIGQELGSKDSTAWNKFRYTMETGMVPVEVSAKYGSGILKRGNITETAQLPIERISKDNADTWWKKAIYYLSRGIKIGNYEFSARALSRFMAATDMLFRQAGTAAALEWQNLSITPDMLANARAQAAIEVEPDQSKNLIAIRADEIIKQQLSENPSTQHQIERAEYIGLETAYSQRPKGMIGSLANYIGELGNKYWPVKMLFPFTNIVANVWNETLNYTPVGAFRWESARRDSKAGRKGDWTIVDKDGNDVADNLQLSKALLGTMLMGVMALMFGGKDDDDYELVGFGPTDKRQRAMFFDRGMKPYSMRIGKTVISYQSLGPIASVIGMIGTMLDLGRQNKNKEQKVWDKPAQLAFGAVASIVTSQLSQSFFSSASSMFQALYSPSPGSGVQRWAAGQVGTVVPNFIKQVNNEWINDGIYRSATFQGQVMASMGVTKQIGTQPVLNVYGEQVRQRKMPVLGRVINWAQSGGIMSDIGELGLSIPIGTSTLSGAPMTDQQNYQFRSTSGPMLKQVHQQLLPTLQRLVSQGKVQEAQDLLDSTTQKVTQRVKQAMARNLRP